MFAAATASLGVACLGGCGSRSTLDENARPTEVQSGCVYDTDCPQGADRCTFSGCRERECVPIAVRDCNDSNECTNDECVPSTGECSHKPVTLDVDGDGFRAPLAGMKSGDPGACGDDCNDANKNAHPGAREICDGVDNDCNGVIDDSTTVAPTGSEVLVSDEWEEESSPKGLGFSSVTGTYLVTYSAQIDQADAYYTVEISPSGARVAPPARFTQLRTSSYAGPIVWTGDRYGTVWNDRRHTNNNYEIYFNQMGPSGTKLGPDLRLTERLGFSVNPSLAWTGSEFVVVWQDDGLTNGRTNQVLAQRVSLDAKAVGDAIRLVDEGQDGQQSPVISAGTRTIGVAWMRGDAKNRCIEFATFAPKLALVGGPTRLTTGSEQGVSASVAYGTSGYTLAWYDPLLEDGITGAVVGEDASVLVAPKRLTDTPKHSRYPAILSYGNRLLLVWSDDKDGNYEIYAKVLNADLTPITREMRVTHGVGASVGAIPRFGPDGDVGLVFRDDRDGTARTYFARLACAPDESR